jgi:uncharacterized protein
MRRLDRRARREAPDVAGQMASAYEAARRNDYAALEIRNGLAHAGGARAHNNIGACFAGGLGVERDATLAVNWLALSARAGDPVGQRHLAATYFKGEGVGQDYARAAELYRAIAFARLTRARNGGSRLARQFFDAVRQLLTPDHAAEAARRAVPLEAA